MDDSVNNFKLKAKLDLDLSAIDKINLEMRQRYQEIYNMMTIVQNNYENKVIKKDKFNVLMEKLDDLLNSYRELESPLSLNDLTDKSKQDVLANVYQLKDRIKDLASECGFIKCSHLLFIHFGYDIKNKISESYCKLIDFYDNFFIPNRCNVEDDRSSVDLDAELLPFAKKNNSSNKSFLEKIEGADIYFPYYNKFLVISGYFRKDPLNICRIGGTLANKLKKVEQEIKFVSIEDQFKQRYLTQLSLRDFLLNDEQEISNMIQSAYKDLLKLRTKPLSLLVKEFISANTERQRYILTLFLLSDSEDQFLAHIIYDMICNTSELLKPQPMAEEIYKSLHYSVQKLFRIALKNVENKIAQLQSLTEDDIPYEKRIAMMKASDNIKSKALEKLKEIKGTRESSAKAQQYLDGMLKIPFGIYKKEPVLNHLADFIDKTSSTVKEFITRLNNLNQKQGYQAEAKELFLAHLGSFSDKNTESTIDKFMNSTGEVLDKLTKLRDNENNKEVKDEETKEEKKDNSKLFLEKLERVKKLSQQLESGDIVNDDVTVDNDDDKSLDESNESDDNIFYYIEKKFVKLVEEWLHYKNEKREYLKTVRKNLNECVYGHEESKDQLERLIAQWMNGKMEGTVFGFQGPPGTGKTSLAKKGLAKCLLDEDGNPRPFGFLPLGGSSNGAILEGHSYTYLGSTWGRIVDILMETKCCNPIIYIDEVDKVSQTEHGREIVGILTHLTDQSQNHEFSDKYFSGIKFDLSKVLFVFSYNDPSAIDRILRDRITEINVKALTTNDKVHIVQDYALPEILETVGYKKGDIFIEKNEIKYIVQTYTNEAGVRKLREKLFELVREINLKKITDGNITLPFKSTEEYIKEVFSEKPVMVKRLQKSLK